MLWAFIRFVKSLRVLLRRAGVWGGGGGGGSVLDVRIGASVFTVLGIGAGVRS